MITGIAAQVEDGPARVLQVAGVVVVALALLGAGVAAALAPQGAPALADGLVRAQLLAAVLTTVWLLASLGGLVRAILPVAVGAVSVVASLGVLRLVAEVTQTATIAADLVVGLAIALSIPWTLQVQARVREESDAGYSSRDAAARTVHTTGRTIASSAATAAACTAGLLAMPQADIRATAAVVMATVVITAVAAVAALPAALAMLGHRVDRLSRRPAPAEAEGAGQRLTSLALGRPLLLGGATAAVLLAVGLPLLAAGTDGSMMPAAAGTVMVRLPLVALVAVAAMVVVLLVEVDSVAAALAAAGSAVLGVAPAVGVLALASGDGVLARLLGTEGTAGVDPTVLALLVCVGLALSMALQVQALTAVKEAHDRTGDARGAVAEGLRQDRALAGVAAVGMVLAWLAFITAGSPPVRQIVLGVALVLLVQATVVREVMLPALLRAGVASGRGGSLLHRLHERFVLTEHADLVPAATASTAAEPHVEPLAEPLAEPEATRVRAVGDYQLVRSLGRDHHSETFLARAPARLGAMYAAVRLFDDVSVPSDHARATAVLERYAAVDSPHLARLLGVGLWEGHLYHATELVPLGSLADPVLPLTDADVVRAGAGAARGLHALHAAGLHHRDIRPRTILLDADGGRLAGLGIVQMLAEERRDLVTAMRHDDTHHRPVSDPGAVAQQVLRGADASVATDLFALGAALHEVLTGTSVYGVLPADPAARHAHVLAAPVVVDASLPAEVRMVLSRLLDIDADDGRYASAEEAAAALDALELHLQGPAATR